MTTHDELDSQIRDQLHTDAPRRAPATLLEDTMTRVAATPQRERSSFFRATGVRLLATAAVLLIAVVAGVQLAGLVNRPSGTIGSPSPSPTVSPPVTETPRPTESPSAEVSPSPSPAGGELPTGPGESVMSFIPGCGVLPPVQVPATTVLEDGRVIWRLDDGTYRVRQLTDQSLEEFEAQVRGTGLFEAPATYELELQPGAEPPGHGVCIWRFTWSDGAQEVEVRSVQWLGDEEEATYYQPAPERETLHALAEQLMRPEDRFGEDGWVQPEATTYQPDEYLILAAMFSSEAATLGAPDVADVSWPFAEPPDGFGVETTGVPSYRCGIADEAAVQTLAAELSAAGLEQFATMPASGVGATLPWAAAGAAVDLSIWILLPDGRPGCESVGS
jgi:hypothetical protein